MRTSTCRGPLRGSAENDQGRPKRSNEEIQDAAHSHFGNERMIESILILTARHSRQTFPSNIGPQAFSQSVEPDAILLQLFRQIARRDPLSRAHVREGFIDQSIR